MANAQAAAAELVKRGRWTPEQADQRAPGWRISVGGAPKLESQERTQLKDARKAAEKAGGVIQDVDRFMALNREQGTGGFLGLPGIRDIHGMFDPEVAEMNSITNRLTPAQREPGSGAMSDGDAAMFRSSVVGTGKPGPANTKMSSRAKGGAMRERDYSAFLDYFGRVNGTLNGAQELWDQYKDAEPVYDPKSGDLRQARPWRDYFGVGGAKPKSAQQGQGGGQDALRREAAEAIRQGAPRDKVIQRLRERGVNTGGL